MCKKYNQTSHTLIHIDKYLHPCINCLRCKPECFYKDDDFNRILQFIKISEHIILGTPVYLDTPTPQVLSLLHRLNCMAENTNRKFFESKKIYLVATAYCSGTKSAISIMMRSCEMLGFTILGRSTREYIQLWEDKKVRGGMNAIEDTIYINE